MYVLTMQPLLLPFQFLSVSSREHPMDLITFNSMRQLPGIPYILMTKLPKLHHILRKFPGNFFEVPWICLWGVPKTPTALGLPNFFAPCFWDF